MKHTILTIAALCATALFLAGCSSEGNPDSLLPLPPVSGTVPLSVESSTLQGEVTTRGVLGAGAKIGVFLAGTGYPQRNNCQYQYGAPSWTPVDAANTIYLGGSTAQVCAYHPWTSGFDNSAAVPLTTQIYASAADLSFDTDRDVDGSKANKSTSFSMTRAYAKLTLSFQRANYPGTCQIQQVEIQNCLTSATLNITDGTYSSPDGTAGTTLSQVTDVTVPDSGTAEIDWLMVPCRPAGAGMTLVLTIDGKTMTTSIPTASYTPVKGEYKTILLSINGTAVDPVSVTLTDWPASTEINDGGNPFIPLP